MSFLLAAWMVLSASVPPAEGREIYVVRRGWHLDVGFRADEIGAPLAPLADTLPGARFLIFGFGDRRYLLAAHRHVPDLLAALWPGSGLILLTALAATPQAAFGESQVVTVRVSPAAFAAAQAFVRESLGDTRVLAPGPYAGSVFLPATARYSARHTCNTWVAEVLQHAGLPVRARGVVFSGPLWRGVLKISRAASCRPSTGSSIPTAPPPSSFPVVAGCCC